MPHADPLAGQVIEADWGKQLDIQGTYTPALTATTNPTLGTGSSQSGWWHRNGHLITGGVFIRFGTSGVNAGSGTYIVDLPFDADLSVLTASTGAFGLQDVIGNGTLRDQDGASNTWQRCAVLLRTASTVHLGVAEGAAVNVLSSAPWTWSAEDSIVFNFAYLADSAGLP